MAPEAKHERLKTKVSELYAQIQQGAKVANLSDKELDCIEETIGLLDRGHLRVASPQYENWVVHEWIKQAILLYFKIRNVEKMDLHGLSFVDKIPVKQWTGMENVRIVPPAVARRGSFIGANAVLMPSFVNIGAHVGEGTMVDTWATVGSCAQIGAHVHLSGGVGIGGVLEPLQASPVIIEDHVFVGSRCVVVEGIRVRQGAVLGAGVVLTSSTKIIDVRTSEPKLLTGEVPANTVVIPGVTMRDFPAGSVGVPCALIIGERSVSTDRKTSLNNVLREFNVSV